VPTSGAAGRTPRVGAVSDSGGPRGTTLLVADPDRAHGDRLAAQLKEEGVLATVCTDGAWALLRAGTLRPDVVLVSARLPVVDAVTFTRVVRDGLDVPVLLGVGGADAAEAVRGLEAGATACVARPYRLPELLPFINGVRAKDGIDDGAAANRRLACGPIELDEAAYEVRVRGRPLPMPPREFELLRYLLLNVDRVVTRQQIQRHVWRKAGDTAMTNTLTVHIKRLRQRLGDDPEQPELILTVRGVGYRLVRP
jgi:two-component system OmpR family response regulator